MIEAGGLLPYTRARLAGREAPPPVLDAPPRRMTLVEKILARHVVTDPAAAGAGVPAVAPGDACFVRADLRFSHEYVTPMAANASRRSSGRARASTDPGSRPPLPRSPRPSSARSCRRNARRAASSRSRTPSRRGRRSSRRAQGIRLHGAGEGICHSLMLERYALPGQVVVGSDSHTTHAGALGCLAFGIGTTEVACAWLSGDVRVKVPATIRVVLDGHAAAGRRGEGRHARAPRAPVREGRRRDRKGARVRGRGRRRRCPSTSGPRSRTWRPRRARSRASSRPTRRRRGSSPSGGELPLDEARRGLRRPRVRTRTRSSIRSSSLDVGALAPIVALPGDPGNGVAISDLPAPVPVDIAYGGSCTAGKREDMEMLAAVLAEGLARGRRVAPGVDFYIQFGSRDVKEWCREKGYLDLFARAGARLVEPGCGACINAGPGVSTRDGRGHGERHQPQFPRAKRTGARLSRKPVRRRRVGPRGQDHRVESRRLRPLALLVAARDARDGLRLSRGICGRAATSRATSRSSWRARESFRRTSSAGCSGRSTPGACILPMTAEQATTSCRA